MLIPVTCVILCFAGCTSGLDPDDFIQRYTELHRSGDIDGLLALHTDDSEFQLPGGGEIIRGKEALRNLFEWDAVLGSDLDMRGISIVGDTIIVDTVFERSKFFQALGMSYVRYEPGTRIVLRNGLIVGTYPAKVSEESQARGSAKYEDLMKWMSINRSEDMERLMPGGKFRHDAENARLWLEILYEWKRSNR
jgi:hypothetical protein